MKIANCNKAFLSLTHGIHHQVLCITSSALSRDTPSFASRKWSQWRSGCLCQTVHRLTIDAADGSPQFLIDEAELRPIQDSVSTLDQGSSPESYGVSAATNRVFDLYVQTMIGSPNSPFCCQGRQGAQSIRR
jgi:hypothetical protein